MQGFFFSYSLIGGNRSAKKPPQPIRAADVDRFRMGPQVVRPPGLPVHRRAAHEADGFVREGQTDEQRAGPARSREFYFCIQGSFKQTRINK